MANSEDYLDGLLDSITKAKTQNESAVQSEAIARRERIERRTRLSADDDFMSANGLDDFEPVASSRKNLKQFFSESDYIKQFEDELDMMDTDEADAFLKEFEEDLSAKDAAFAAELSDSPAEQFLGSINEKVTEAKESVVNNLENFSFDNTQEEEETEENLEVAPEEPEDSFDMEIPQEEVDESVEESLDTDDILSGVQDIISDAISEETAEPLEESVEDVMADALEEPTEEAIEEAEEEPALEAAEDTIEEISPEDFGMEDMPDLDTMDISAEGETSEIPEITDASVQEVPLMDENGEDADLMDMLGDSGDLMDIGDLLSADENFEELDEARDEFEAAASEAVEKGTSLEEGSEGEEEAPGGIFGKIMGIVKGLLGKVKKEGEEDEDGTVEIGENAPTMEELAAEDADILSEFSDEETPVEEDPKEKKKREKEEKKKQKQAEKEAKKKEKEAAKAAKPPKEKKEKKPKEPDNSPKIPMKGILPILVLGLSVVAFVLISGNTIYKNRTIKEAKSLYENGSYSACYSKLYPMEEDLDEDEAELLQKARMLAKLELNLKEYNLAMSQEKYGEALDALLLGTYTYQRNAYDAERLHISDQFNELGTQIETTLAQQFGVSEEDAMMIVRLPKRKEYTKKVHEILRSVNLE